MAVRIGSGTLTPCGLTEQQSHTVPQLDPLELDQAYSTWAACKGGFNLRFSTEVAQSLLTYIMLGFRFGDRWAPQSSVYWSPLLKLLCLLSVLMYTTAKKTMSFNFSIFIISVKIWKNWRDLVEEALKLWENSRWCIELKLISNLSEKTHSSPQAAYSIHNDLIIIIIIVVIDAFDLLYSCHSKFHSLSLKH